MSGRPSGVSTESEGERFAYVARVTGGRVEDGLVTAGTGHTPLVLSVTQAPSPARRSGARRSAEDEGPTMPVTEHERHQLFRWFEEHLGSERAATLMSLLPPVGWGDVATRRDLDEHIAATRRDVDQHFAATRRDVDQHFAATRHELDQHFAATRNDIEVLRHELREVEERLDARIDIKLDAKLGLLRGELLRTFGTWLFASQAVVIAAVSMLVAFD
jgi:hypothetical protein